MSEFLAVICLKEDVIQWVAQAYRRTKEKKNSDCIDIVHFISIDDQEGYKLWKIVADLLIWWLKWKNM